MELIQLLFNQWKECPYREVVVLEDEDNGTAGSDNAGVEDVMHGLPPIILLKYCT